MTQRRKEHALEAGGVSAREVAELLLESALDALLVMENELFVDGNEAQHAAERARKRGRC